jgi:hypothetical protein
VGSGTVRCTYTGTSWNEFSQQEEQFELGLTGMVLVHAPWMLPSTIDSAMQIEPGLTSMLVLKLFFSFEDVPIQ